jgi:uncharacterized protein (UPF0332 family)
VKPETAAYLEKARVFLNKARGMLANEWPDEAGRAAYMAGFHAAQALIFESTGRAVKSHGGVQGELARLVKNEPRFSVEHRRFLGRAYNYKAAADYETGPAARVTPAQAQEAIDTAESFVLAVLAIMPPNGANQQ